MDIQAWRRHLQQVHGVAKDVLSTQFHEHAALVNVSRPCTFCRLPFQKSPKLHRAKCLPLAQLLSVKHGYAGIGRVPDCGSVGASFAQPAGQPPEDAETEDQVLVSRTEVADRAPNHPRSAGEARSGTQPSGGGSYLRAVLLDHRNVDPDHATHSDEPLARAVRAGELRNGWNWKPG